MEEEAEAQVASARDVAAAEDSRRQKQKERLDALVLAQDFAGAAALKAEIEKEAKAEVAQGTSLGASKEGGAVLAWRFKNGNDRPASRTFGRRASAIDEQG